MSAAFFTRSSNRTEKTVPLTQMAGAYHAAGHAVANIVQGLDLHPVNGAGGRSAQRRRGGS
jgi:hypothetical protein